MLPLRSAFRFAPILVALAALSAAPRAAGVRSNGLDFDRLAALRQVREVEISPDGTRVAYTLSVPRRPGVDDDGSAWSELHVVSIADGTSRPYVQGEVNVSEIAFTPDNRYVTYLAERGDDEERGLWAIPVHGGESRKLIERDFSISGYRVSPDGRRVVYHGVEPESKAREKAKKKGYKQEVFEEDRRGRRVWVTELPPFEPPIEDPQAPNKDEEESDPEPLPIEGSVFHAEWSPDGGKLALAVAPRPLIDDRYMKRTIRIVDAETGDESARVDHSGKLGDFHFSPDGSQIAMIAAADPNDPREGRLKVAPSSGGIPRDVMPALEAHVSQIAWQDAHTVMYVVDEGVETVLGEVDVRSGTQATHGNSGDGSPVLRRLRLSEDGGRAALLGESPSHPGEVFVLGHGEARPRRLTDSNPWLASVELAKQESVRWQARDGLLLDGVLIRPLKTSSRRPSPLLLMVHGGPEAHDRNGWLTSYSRPGQLAAAQGYAVFYPNYRGSTGRGVPFSKLGQGDAAGREFDDLVDAVDYLASERIADSNRVGITGGSYGGYATAWCSTRHSERFRAGVMFVGISNKLSKGLTTEIPVEDKMVHTLFDPWTRWDFSLERSPIYHAEKSRTALLISGGTADTRVHPSQSLQLYRALKLIGKTPVRYVRYPGEPHGNRKAAARDDYARRLMRWMDHFVVKGNTELPPWELEIEALSGEANGDD